MAAIDRLLRANRKIMQVPVYEKADGSLVIVSPTGTTCPFDAPTAAVLSAWAAVLETDDVGAHHGGNVSCAILDDVTLGLGDSETDTELTICSIGNEADPTFANVEAQITALRDKNKADTGVFNLFTFLNVGVDTRYGWVDVIGKPSSAVVAIGDIVSIYDALNDVPIDVWEDRGNLKIQQNPAPTGNIVDRYEIAA